MYKRQDLLPPETRKIRGGAGRGPVYGNLQARVADLGLTGKNLWGYPDPRRWGSAPHSGFGLGFDRLLLFVTGMTNIRDVQPFPRTPQHADF